MNHRGTEDTEKTANVRRRSQELLLLCDLCASVVDPKRWLLVFAVAACSLSAGRAAEKVAAPIPAPLDNTATASRGRESISRQYVRQATRRAKRVRRGIDSRPLCPTNSLD